MAVFFYSNKVDFTEGTPPENFADFFPLVAISTEEGAFIHRNDGAVGTILKISSCRPNEMSLIANTLVSWLRTSKLVDNKTAFTINLQKRVYIIGNQAEQMDLGVEAIVSITTSCSMVSSSKTGSLKYYFEKFSKRRKKADVIAENFETLFLAITEILALLKEDKLSIRHVSDSREALATARRFWTESAPTDVNNTDDPASFFANGLAICPGRTFWRDGSYLKMMFGLRVPPASLVAEESIKSEDAIAGLAGMDDVHQPGAMHVMMSAGGPMLTHRESAVAGTYRLNLNVEAPENDLSLSGDTPSQDDLVSPREALLRPIRMAALYIATLPWDESIGDTIGTFAEQSVLSSLEANNINQLTKASRGAEWHLIDTLWLEALFATVPGGTRLDRKEFVQTFDVIHFF